jgi:hypothetical protein
MKCGFLQRQRTVPSPCILPFAMGNAASSGARRWLLTACIPKIAACHFYIQRLSSFRPFWSLLSLTTISPLCYSSCRLVPISQRMPGIWAMTLCEESAMSMHIIASSTMSATTSLHVTPIDAAGFLWQVDTRRSVLPMVICFQQITRSLARTMFISQDHAGQQTHRVDGRTLMHRGIADHFYHLRLVKPPALAVGIQEAFLLVGDGMGPRRRRAITQHSSLNMILYFQIPFGKLEYDDATNLNMSRCK